MHYLAYGSLAFPKSNERELKGIFNDYVIVSRYLNLFIIQSRNIDLRKKAAGARFIYRILKLPYHGPVHDAGYLESIRRVLEGAQISEKRLKIECFDVLSRRGYSAKDIEVFLGQGLEKKRVPIDIARPEALCYVVLFRMQCYIGFMPYKQLMFVDPGRHYKGLSNNISRAEFKLLQAIDEFKLRRKLSGIVLDIGAAPGGWTSQLSKAGMKVIAVDKGILDYDRLNELGISVCVIEDGKPAAEDIGEFDVVDVKSGFGGVSLAGVGKLSMITCDMNVSPEETADAVLMFSKRLKKNGMLLTTIKCTTRDINKHVGIAIKRLEIEFAVKGVKALPSNRQEATLYAVKR